MSNLKTAEIHLPYFKQGDDLNNCWKKTKNTIKAFEEHANLMRDCAEHLKAIGYVLKNHQHGNEVEIYADTHYISITGPDYIIETLIDVELAEDFEENDGDIEE